MIDPIRYFSLMCHWNMLNLASSRAPAIIPVREIINPNMSIIEWYLASACRRLEASAKDHT